MDNKPAVYGYCFVADCPNKRTSEQIDCNNTDRLQFFGFPDAKNYAVRQRWVLFCARDDGEGGLLEPGGQRICSRHFADDDIQKIGTEKNRPDRRKPLKSWRLRDISVCPSLNPPKKSFPTKNATSLSSAEQPAVAPTEVLVKEIPLECCTPESPKPQESDATLVLHTLSQLSSFFTSTESALPGEFSIKIFSVTVKLMASYSFLFTIVYE